MYTRSTALVAFIIAFAAGVLPADGSASSSPIAAGDGNHPSEHVHNLLRQRRVKAGKGTKDNNEAKSSKQGDTRTDTGEGGGTGTGSAGFNDLKNLQILGSGGTIGDNDGDDESQDGGGDDSDPTNDTNRGDVEDNADENTGGGSDNAANPAGLECGRGILTAGGPFETEQCNGSCECYDNCCIQHTVARFCAPRGNNGMSTLGGGFKMRCI